MTGYTYDDATHTYAIGGRGVISVTQAMVEAGIVDTKWFTDYGRRRGSAVHKAIQFHVEGTLDLNSIDPKIRGYLDAYQLWEADTGFEARESELKMWSPALQAAGTLDLLGDFRNGPGIVDIKTGKAGPETGIQLTGYADLWRAETGSIEMFRLVGLQLNIDGKYKMKPFEPDYKTWRAALTVARWKRENR